MMSTPQPTDPEANLSPDAPTDAPPAGGPPETGAAPAPASQPSYGFLVVVALVNLVADLATKYWAEKNLQTPSQIPLPKSLFKAAYGGFGFMLARNKGGGVGAAAQLR